MSKDSELSSELAKLDFTTIYRCDLSNDQDHLEVCNTRAAYIITLQQPCCIKKVPLCFFHYNIINNNWNLPQWFRCTTCTGEGSYHYSEWNELVVNGKKGIEPL